MDDDEEEWGCRQCKMRHPGRLQIIQVVKSCLKGRIAKPKNAQKCCKKNLEGRRSGCCRGPKWVCNRSPMWSVIENMIGLCYFMLEPTHFGPLPQPLIKLSRFFLHHFWAFLGFAILPFGQLFTTWMICNLPGCLILHCLQPHSSSSSSMLSLAIMGLYNFSIRLIMSPVDLCSLLGFFGKSVCQVSPYLPTPLYWPIGHSTICTQCFPPSF